MFRDKQGVPLVYANRVAVRFLADEHYLRQLKAGADEKVAARRTCERHGHDDRGGRCDRCGLGVPRRRRAA